MGRILKFEFYHRDTLCTSVKVDYGKQSISVVNYTDNILDQAFGKAKITVDSIDEFFRERCFPETRVNAKELLEAYGLEEFDAESMVKITHGMMVDDEYWVKFDGDPDTVNWDLIQKIKDSL